MRQYSKMVVLAVVLSLFVPTHAVEAQCGAGRFFGGLVAGAILAGALNSSHHYYGPYYDPSYGYDPYYYGYASPYSYSGCYSPYSYSGCNSYPALGAYSPYYSRPYRRHYYSRRRYYPRYYY